jgi:hypothetical protein
MKAGFLGTLYVGFGSLKVGMGALAWEICMKAGFLGTLYVGNGIFQYKRDCAWTSTRTSTRSDKMILIVEWLDQF